MSRSFALENGDLVLGNGRSFRVVTGKAKLHQDLKLHILERIGTDPATPTYGSRLEGGTIDGQAVPGFIGRMMSQPLLDQIRMEVLRVVQQYQQDQYNRLSREIYRLQGQVTLDRDETIETIQDVRVRAIGDRVIVQVTLMTAGREPVKITLPVQ